MQRGYGHLAIVFAAACPAAVLAQNAPAHDAPTTAPTDDQSEIVDRNGVPLSPEKQEEVRNLLKRDSPAPSPDATAAPTPAGAPPNVIGFPANPADGDIRVTGQRPRGSVRGDIPASQTFNPLDIRAYGADDIGELIQTLGPQVSSNRGRDDAGPVVLLNGKRISSFLEITKIPTEAIERMEIFPEELALKYGYGADQKVVNIVTYRHYSSETARASYAFATEGGRSTAGAGGGVFRIAGGTRINLDAAFDRSGNLLESERGVLQNVDTPGAGRYRTVLPAADQLDLSGTIAGEVLTSVSAALNARFTTEATQSLLGLSGTRLIARSLDTQRTHLGSTANGAVGPWQWTATANYDRAVTRTATDSPDVGAPRDLAQSTNSGGSAMVLAAGKLLALPAGPLSTNIELGVEALTLTGTSKIGAAYQQTRVQRTRGSAQASIDIPLASRRSHALAAAGELSANVNVRLDSISDVGDLRTIGYGITWSPDAALSIIASATDEEGAPTPEQIGSPLVVTPNVQTFDAVTRASVSTTRIFGGNPLLRTDSRHVAKLGINARPIKERDLVLSLDAVRTVIDDPIAAFPIPLPPVEAAFPERFLRDPTGQLIQVDARPLNFARSEQAQFRFGANFTRPLGTVPPELRNATPRFIPSQSDIKGALPPGARVIQPPPGSAESRPFENLSSRLILSAYYTLTAVDRVWLRSGLPALDLLDGFALGNRGGSARHKVEVQASVYKHGIGARVATTWQSGSVVRGQSDGAPISASDLRFGSYTVTNATLFANIADAIPGAKAAAWTKGLRIALSINNLFDARPSVHDGTGYTPLVYQPAYLDPLGRSVNLSVRKVF